MAVKDTERFAANLKVVCAQHGSVQAIAEDAGVTRVFVSRVIHGHATPSLDVASRIAHAAGLTLGEMLLPPAEFARKHGKKFAAQA